MSRGTDSELTAIPRVDQVEIETAYVEHLQQVCGDAFDSRMACRLASQTFSHEVEPGNEQRVGHGEATFLALSAQAFEQRIDHAWPSMTASARANLDRSFRVLWNALRYLIRAAKKGSDDGSV